MKFAFNPANDVMQKDDSWWLTILASMKIAIDDMPSIDGLPRHVYLWMLGLLTCGCLRPLPWMP